MTDNNPSAVWVSTMTHRKLWVRWKVLKGKHIYVSQAQKSTKQKMKAESNENR